jgi:hypothetical protein
MTNKVTHTICPECNTCFTPDAHDILIKSLIADNDRMREALKILSQEKTQFCCECPDIQEFARAALEEK